MMIAAFFSGIGAGLLWNAQSSFLVHISSAENIGKNSGVFFLFYQSSSVVGNIISASVIMVSVTNSIMFGVFSAMAALGLVAMLFLITPPLSGEEEQENIMNTHQRKEENADNQSVVSNKPKKLAKKIFVSFILMRQKGFLLLMPFFIANGLMQAFYFSTFTSILGKEWIGWIMSVFGASDAMAVVLLGKFVKEIGCKIVAIIATVAIIGPIVVLNTVPFDELYGWIGSFFILAAFLGISDAAFTTILFVGISSYFPTEVAPAFGAFRFCQALSSAGVFFLTPYVPFSVGSYIAAVGSGLALISILVADLKYQSLDKPKENNVV